MSRPFPEFTGERYKVSPTKPVPGLPVTDVHERTMAVPLGNNPKERAIRAHEMAHALDAEVRQYENVTEEEFVAAIKAKHVRMDSWKAALELKVNTAAEKAGIDLSPMGDDDIRAIDVASAAQAIASGDARDIARAYCIMSGAGRRSSFNEAWADNFALDDDVRALCERAFARLDAAADAASLADAEWGFRTARYLDRLVDEQKQLEQPKPKPEKQQKQAAPKNDGDKQQGNGKSDDGDDWSDVPDWDDDEEDEPEESEDEQDDSASDTNDEPEEDESEEDDSEGDDEPEASDADEEDDNEEDDNADEFADGEDEDDPTDGISDPHANINFDDLVEAELKRALKRHGEKGIAAWGDDPTNEMPNSIVSEAWWRQPNGAQEPERTVATENGRAARKPQQARAGRFRRGDQMYVDNGKPCARPLPAKGASIMWDMSGSMAPQPENVETLLAAAPGSTIWGYSDRGIFLLVKDGMRVPDLLAYRGGWNAMDGPALRYLAEQDGPRIWVSDNYVNGEGGATEEQLYRECAEICLAGRIVRVDRDGGGYYRSGTERDWQVPASFVGYDKVADALRLWHSIH